MKNVIMLFLILRLGLSNTNLSNINFDPSSDKISLLCTEYQNCFDSCSFYCEPNRPLESDNETLTTKTNCDICIFICLNPRSSLEIEDQSGRARDANILPIDCEATPEITTTASSIEKKTIIIPNLANEIENHKSKCIDKTSGSISTHSV